MSRAIIHGSKLMQAWGVQFYALDAGGVAADALVMEHQQGPQGYAHGGVLAALLDEAMGTACWLVGGQSVSAHLDFDYKRPVPLGMAIRITAQVERREGRKLFTVGSILLTEEGALAVSSSGIFVDAPQLLGNTFAFSLDSEPL